MVFACLWGACLGGGNADAARWQDHRANALQAVDEADTLKAIEQLEAAIYYAQEQLAADRDIANLWEHLTAAYLAEGQFRRAWEATLRWDTILAANAAEPWAPEQQRRRDQMTRLLFEQTRKTPAEDDDSAETAGVPSAPRAADASERPLLLAGEPAPPTVTEAGEPQTPELLPAGDPAQTATAPTVAPTAAAAPDSGADAQPGPPLDPAAYGIHLASFGSEANARKSWPQLQAQYPDVLNGKTLALRSVDLGDRGVFVRVIAVPYADSAAARAVCRDLERRAQYCAVLRPD